MWYMFTGTVLMVSFCYSISLYLCIKTISTVKHLEVSEKTKQIRQQLQRALLFQVRYQ